MIKSPLTNRNIKINGLTYKKLIKLGILIHKFNAIPDDVIFEISNWLSMYDLSNFTQCNKKINQICNNNIYYKKYKKNKKLVVCGYNFTLIIKNSKLFACGLNDNGQLTDLERHVYTIKKINNNPYIIAINCGYNHCIFLDKDILYGIGSNQYGQIASNEFKNYNKPQKININDIISIHCGYHHTIIYTKYNLYSFGSNDHYQLGVRYSESINIIDNFKNIVNDIIKISCGAYHNIILTKTDIYGFGSNISGQLGFDNNDLAYNLPKIIPFLDKSGFIDVSCGYAHSIIITTNHIYGAGSNTFGELGNNDITHKYSSFTKINIDKAISVSCGDHHSIVLTKDNNVYVFGENFYGQLGIKNVLLNYMYTEPQKININTDHKILHISCGSNHTILCVNRKNNIRYYGFGGNIYGALGLGKYTKKSYCTPQLLHI